MVKAKKLGSSFSFCINGFSSFFTMPLGIMMLKSYHWITLTKITFEGHLGEAKALWALLDSLQQVGPQLVIGLQREDQHQVRKDLLVQNSDLVGRQVQLIEASVGSGKPISRPDDGLILKHFCSFNKASSISFYLSSLWIWNFCAPFIPSRVPKPCRK